MRQTMDEEQVLQDEKLIEQEGGTETFGIDVSRT